MKRQSNRFNPSKLMEMMVPILLSLLALALLAVLVLVGLSVLGWKPGI